MSKIYVIARSTQPGLSGVEAYATRELAQATLRKLADERRHGLGVDVIVDTPDVFEYLIGWEERDVRFAVVEITLHDVGKE